MTNKTIETDASVEAYLSAISPDQKQTDCRVIADMMQNLTGHSPKMWGPSIVGFGRYHYKYESGREGDALRTGFAARAQNISIYIMPGYQDFEDELSRLGKHKIGKSCLYIKRLSDVDVSVLEEMIAKGLRLLAKKYPE
ncbi:uncharacterized protein DUF1801 [Litorimonas taeanensis]|uniref:Uncharacterized protein DUF1801 n=1 Tax=Litorimonas taeanensis TaxID=568099 RepID=A0A420WL76_9PROT|nr:DUF1801 domain-containing protein [Litorimonas taeanensis]RKQ71729.1 uncharacterized protein DUF1801 [Litorimonas taeanensis]